MRAPPRLARLWASRDGAAAVVVALFSAVLLGFTAITVDGANFYLLKRRQQTATDLAAMAAATTPDQAQGTAASLMTTNGFGSAALQITRGTYTPDPSIGPSGRFVPSAAGNAVKIVSTVRQPFIFGSAFQTILGGPSAVGFPVRTMAIARKQDEAAFTLGTGLVAVDNGLLNAVLGGLLNTHLSLSLLDYQALATASVDLFAFSDALATRLQTSAPTYGTLAVTAAAENAVLASIADTLQGSASAAPAARAIAASVPSGTVQIGRLVDFGSAAAANVGKHPLSARVGVLDLIMAMARLLGDRNVLSLDLGTTVPGLGSTQLMLTTGESSAGAAFATVGPEGTTLHSAQVRLLLTTQIGGAGLPATMTLPIYIEVASGTATVASIACGSGAANATVGLSVTTGLVDAWIGRIATSSFGNLTSAPTVTPATLFDVAGVMHVTGISHVTPSSTAAIPVNFTAADIRAAATKTVASSVSLADTMASLAGQTQVSVTMLGLNLPQPGLPGAVTAAITTALTPIDQLAARTLALLGVSVGTATTSVPGVRCGQGQLVN